ncbi:S53 family peptidase [Marinomonas shanghaiensis]|uniref:S53 family peptidase n=1 Tax=Marinomonas shanghaiensis TaxID=2202418 RepID=UPI000DB91E19|nr:S53 family peptidase [Marinomonas shanghaiensis]
MPLAQHSKLTQTIVNESSKGYSPQEIAAFYQFPDNLGESQTVGILALGGVFNPADLSTFCQLFNLPTPTVKIVGEVPESEAMADLETNLDVQMVAGIVPKATIVLYYAPSFSFTKGFQMILDDEENKVNVVSTSWAIGEKYLSPSDKKALKNNIKALNERKVTILAASGDNGIYQASSNNKIKGINLPAGYEQVIACGGTTLYKDGKEQVWNEEVIGMGRLASGGSFSHVTAAPAFQQAALDNYAKQQTGMPTNKLATPDISANASKTHFSIMISKGEQAQAWGTSAATPVLAGLIARLNSALGYNLGDCNPLLYQLMGTNAFNSNIPGSNGFPAASGWDPCTGLGSPHGENLLAAIRTLKAPKNT